MRLIPLIPAAFIVCSGLSFAQDWTDYVSRQDFFSISFPGQPNVREITYPTEYRITLPGRLYSQEGPRGRYSVTVVNYTDAIKLHQERNKKCVADGGDGDQCQDDASEEMRGAIVFASWNFINRQGAKVIHYAHYNSDVIEGHEIHLHEWRRLANLWRRAHARGSPLYPRGHGAQGCAASGAVPDFHAIPRRAGERGPLSVG